MHSTLQNFAINNITPLIDAPEPVVRRKRSLAFKTDVMTLRFCINSNRLGLSGVDLLV